MLSHSVLSNSLWPHGPYVACQAPLSMEFSRQEYWTRLPFPTLVNLPNSESESSPLACPELAGRFFFKIHLCFFFLCGYIYEIYEHSGLITFQVHSKMIQLYIYTYILASLVVQLVKSLPAMQEIWVRTLSWEDPMEKGNSNPLQYSCLKSHGGAWQVHGVTRSRSVRLSDFHYTHILFVRLLSIIDYYKILTRVPCAIQ